MRISAITNTQPNNQQNFGTAELIFSTRADEIVKRHLSWKQFQKISEWRNILQNTTNHIGKVEFGILPGTTRFCAMIYDTDGAKAINQLITHEDPQIFKKLFPKISIMNFIKKVIKKASQTELDLVQKTTEKAL